MTDPAVQRPRRRKHKPKAHIASPRVWPTWALVGGAWVIAHLPLGWIFWLGKQVGRGLYRFAHARREITLTNLRACFPELNEAEIETLARRVFTQVSIGGLEMMVPWLAPGRDLTHRFEIEGLVHLQEALAQKRGVILVGAHFASMDGISQGLAGCGSIDVMYRLNKNPVWEWLQVSGRKRYFEGVIERDNTRAALRSLRKGRAIWYAADQDYGAKHSVFAPFFGIQAATLTATSRFARLNQSPTLILQQTRDIDRRVWKLKFHPVLQDFPSGDEQADAERLNGLLEAIIREQPDQYLWLHKRFKTRPDGSKAFYARR